MNVRTNFVSSRTYLIVLNQRSVSFFVLEHAFDDVLVRYGVGTLLCTVEQYRWSIRTYRTSCNNVSNIPLQLQQAGIDLRTVQYHDY